MKITETLISPVNPIVDFTHVKNNPGVYEIIGQPYRLISWKVGDHRVNTALVAVYDAERNIFHILSEGHGWVDYKFRKLDTKVVIEFD